MRTLQVSAILLAALAADAQTMYRCKGADGQLAFQQLPCAEGKGEKVEARQVPTTEMGANILERVRRNRADEMTEEDLLRAYGQPTTVNTDVVNGQTTRQYVYNFAGGGTKYFYSRNGVIYATQDRPGYPSPKREPCYSRQDIENAKTSASSITLSSEQRRAARSRVTEMESCRK